MLKKQCFYFLLAFCFYGSFCHAEKAKPQKGRSGAALPLGERLGKVNRIILQGNQLIDSNLIRSHLSDSYARIKAETLWTKRDIQKDVRHLFSLGFFEDIQVRGTQSKKGGWLLFYQFKERSYISSIEFKGNNKLNEKELKEDFLIKEYEFLNPNQLKKALNEVKKQYEEKAYYLADISYQLKQDDKNKTAYKLVIEIKENSKLLIKKIQFIGNRSISADKLKPFMQLKEKNLLSFLGSGGVYQKEALDRDLQFIEYYYRNEGYLNVKVYPPKISISPDKKNLFLNFKISEGIRYKIGEYFLKEEELISKKDNFKLPKLEYFSLGALQQDIQLISNIYKNKGYAFVKVEPFFYPDRLEENKIHISFKVDKGEKYKIRRIKIIGNKNLRDKVIFRRFQIKEGDFYNQDQIDLTRRLLEQLAVIEKVDISPVSLPFKSKELDLTTITKERESTGEASLVGGYNSHTKLFIQGNLKKDNFLGLEQSVAVKVSLGYYDETLVFHYQNPYFLDTKWNFGFELFNVGHQSYTGSGSFNVGQLFANNDYRTYFSLNTGFSVSVGRKLSSFSTLFLKYRLSDQQISEEALYFIRKLPLLSSIFGILQTQITPSTIQADQKSLKENINRYRFSDLYNFDSATGLKSSASIVWENDRRNDRFYSTSGFFMRVTGELTGLGGDFNHTKLTGDFRHYYNPIWKLVVKNRFDLGWVFSNSKSKEIPFTELFLLGGPYSLRGFLVNSQGPKKRSEEAYQAALNHNKQEDIKDKIEQPEKFAMRPYGGSQKFFYSLELEIPIVEQAGLRLASFLDAGEANNGLAFDLNDQLRVNAGVGLRWLSPFGPLSLDFAVPYKPRKSFEESSWEVQFSLGSVF